MDAGTDTLRWAMDTPPRFDIPLPPPRVEPTPRWVRVRAGDMWVADSREAMLLAWYGPRMLPTYWFPERDVRTELMSLSGDGARHGMVAHDVRAGDEVIEGAAQLFRDPPAPLAELRDYWSLTWNGRVAWSRRRSRCTSTRATPPCAWTSSRASATCVSSSAES